MSIHRVGLLSDVDETGEPVEFTWDLFPLVDASETTHLDENGLPKPGTRIREGMILVGRIGKTRDFDPSAEPTALEVHGLPLEELRQRFGHMWKDYSHYATRDETGVVLTAHLSDTPSPRTAIIELTGDTNERLTVCAISAEEI